MSNLPPMHRMHALGMLGLRDQPDADMATIKKAYRKQALQWHPDRNPDKRDMAEMMIRQINAAYDFLKENPKGASNGASNGASTDDAATAARNRAGRTQAQRQADAAYGRNPFRAGESLDIPVDDEQLELLGKICDLMGLEKCGESFNYILQFSTQLTGKLLYMTTFLSNDVTIGPKGKNRGKRLYLRATVLDSCLKPRAGSHRIRTPDTVGRYMAETMAIIDPRLVDRNMVLCAVAFTLKPLYQMLQAELEKGHEVAILRLLTDVPLDEPVCIAFWKAIHPGKTTADAVEALRYGQRHKKWWQ